MALKGLKKSDLSGEKQVDIEEFIGGAKKRVDALKPPKTKREFERYNFSLTPAVSAQIDKLALHPNFRASRSDVVKAAILYLSEQDEFTINTAMARIVK